MAQTNINICMNESTKRDFDYFCKKIAISVSTAFDLFTKTAVRENRVSFKIIAHIPNEVNKEAMREAEYIAAHPDKFKSYTSVDEMFNDILKKMIRSLNHPDLKI